MAIVELDKKGRLTIPKSQRSELHLSGKVLVLNAGDHLKVVPIPKDPVQALRGAFSVRKSFRELRKQAELQAEREIAEKV